MGVITPRQALSLYGRDNPFASPAAISTSNYSAFVEGTLVRLLDWKEPSAQARLAHQALRGFLLSSAFSCVGGKAAIESGGYRFASYQDSAIRSAPRGWHVIWRPSLLSDSRCSRSTQHFWPSLRNRRQAAKAGLKLCSGEFCNNSPISQRHIIIWDPSVSSDAAAATFGFSFAGERILRSRHASQQLAVVQAILLAGSRVQFS